MKIGKIISVSELGVEILTDGAEVRYRDMPVSYTHLRRVLESFKKTVQTVTDNVMEGRIFTKTQLVDGKWKLIMRLSGWQNLDKVSSAMLSLIHILMVMANSGDYREPQIFTYTYEALLQTNGIKLTYPPEGKGKLYLDVYWDSSKGTGSSGAATLLPETDYYVYLFGDYANLAMIEQDMAYASGFGLLGDCKFNTPK